MANRLYQIERISGNTIQFSGDVGTVWYAVTDNIRVTPTSGVIEEDNYVYLEIINAENINAYGSITIYSDYCKPLYLGNIAYFSDYPKRRVEIVYLDSNHTSSSVTISETDTFTYTIRKHDGFNYTTNSSSITFTFANETDYETREWIYTVVKNSNLFVDVLVISKPSNLVIDCDNVECMIDPNNITLTYNEPSCAINAYALYDGYRYIPFTLTNDCGTENFTFSQDASIITFSVNVDVLADDTITTANCSFNIASNNCGCNGIVNVNYDRYGGEDDDLYGSIVFTLIDNTTSAVVTNISASISLLGNSGKYKYRTNFINGVALFKKVRYDENNYTYAVTIDGDNYTFNVLSSITTPCDVTTSSVSPTNYVESKKDTYSVVGSSNQVASPIYETIKKDIPLIYTEEIVPWKPTQWSDNLTSVTNGIVYAYDTPNFLGYDVYDTATLQQDGSMLAAQLPFIHEASAYTIFLSSLTIPESAVTSVNVFNGLESTQCDSEYGELNSNDVTLVFTNGNYPIVVEYIPNDDPFANWSREETIEIRYREQILNLNNVGFLSNYHEFVIQNSGITSTTARVNNGATSAYTEAVGDGPYPLTYKYEKDCQNDWTIENGFNLVVTENTGSTDVLCDINYVAYSSLTVFDSTTIVPYNGVIHVIQKPKDCTKSCGDILVTSVVVDEDNIVAYSGNPNAQVQIHLKTFYVLSGDCDDEKTYGESTYNTNINIPQNPSTARTDYSGTVHVEMAIADDELGCTFSGDVPYVYTQEGLDNPCEKECDGVAITSSSLSPTSYPYSGGNGTLTVIFKVNYHCGETTGETSTQKTYPITIPQNPSTASTSYTSSYTIAPFDTETDPSCTFSGGTVQYSYNQDGDGSCTKECNGVVVTSSSLSPTSYPYSGGNGTLTVNFTVNYLCNGTPSTDNVIKTYPITIPQNPTTASTSYTSSYTIAPFDTETDPSCRFSGGTVQYGYEQDGQSVPCEWVFDGCNINDLYCVPNPLVCSGGTAVVYASSVTYNYVSNGHCSQATSSVTEHDVVLTSVTYSANNTDSSRQYTLNLSGTTTSGCNLDGISLIVPQGTCCLACNSITTFTCMTIPKSGGTDVLIATYNLSQWCDDNKTSATIEPLTTEVCTPEHYEITSCSNGEIRGIIPQNICDGDFLWVVKMYYNGVLCTNASGNATQNGVITTTNITMPMFLQMNDGFSGTVNSGVTTIFVPLGFLETELDSQDLTMTQVVNDPNFVTLVPLTNYLFDYIGTNACTIANDSTSPFHDSVFKYADRYGQTCDAQWTDIDTLMATYDYLSDYPQKHMGGFSVSPLDGSIMFTGTAESNLDNIMRDDSLYSGAVSFAAAFAEDNTIDRSVQPFVITKNNKKVYIVYKQGLSLYCGNCYGVQRDCVQFVDYNYGENKIRCKDGSLYEWFSGNDNKQTFVLSMRPIFFNPLIHGGSYTWSFSTTYNTVEESETVVPYDNNFPSISNNKLDGLSGNTTVPITLFKHTADTIRNGIWPFINELQTNRTITGTTNMFPLNNGWQRLSFDNWYHDIDESKDTFNKISDEQMLFGFVNDNIMKEFEIEVIDEDNNVLTIDALNFTFTDYTDTPSGSIYIYDPPSTSVTADLPLFKTTMGSPLIEGEDSHGDAYHIENGDPNYVYLTPKVRKLIIHVNLDIEETVSIDIINEN